MKTPKFIAFEGVDGIEKSRQISLLAECLRSKGESVLVTGEPFGTQFGSSVFSLMSHFDLDDSTKSLLMYAMRCDHVRCVIQPALDRGEWVLCNRFSGSTKVFQSYSLASYPSVLEIHPDMTFYFNVDAQVLLERSNCPVVEAGEQLKEIERIQGAYLALAAKDPDRFLVLDGEKSSSHVHNLVLAHLLVAPVASPTIKLYSPNNLDLLIEEGKDTTEYADRIKGIVKRLVKSGDEHRYLATIPHHYNSVIDEFEGLFPNFSAFAEFLRERFSLSSLGDKRFAMPPVLFFGEPGIGKTEAAMWIAERIGTTYKILDMATAQSNSSLVGSDSFWSNAREGLVFELLAYQKCANPLIILEEIDKIDSETRYNPISPLYTLLQKRSAEQFSDLSIRDFILDASHIAWVATANDRYAIPKAIFDRFITFDILPPTPFQTAKIANTIYKNILSQNSWGHLFPEVLSNDLMAFIEHQECGPRNLVKVINKALGMAAKNNRRTLQREDFMFDTSIRRSIGFVEPTSVIKQNRRDLKPRII
jgi:dTMP kinase